MRGQNSGSGQRVKMNVSATAFPLKSASASGLPSCPMRTVAGAASPGLPYGPCSGIVWVDDRRAVAGDDDALEPRGLLAHDELRLDLVAGLQLGEHLRLGDVERHRHRVHVAPDLLVPHDDLRGRRVDGDDDALERVRLLGGRRPRPSGPRTCRSRGRPRGRRRGRAFLTIRGPSRRRAAPRWRRPTR